MAMGQVSCLGTTKGTPNPGVGIAVSQALTKRIQLTSHNLTLAVNALLDSGTNGEAFIHPRSARLQVWIDAYVKRWLAFRGTHVLHHMVAKWMDVGHFACG